MSEPMPIQGLTFALMRLQAKEDEPLVCLLVKSRNRAHNARKQWLRHRVEQGASLCDLERHEHLRAQLERMLARPFVKRMQRKKAA